MSATDNKKNKRKLAELEVEPTKKPTVPPKDESETKTLVVKSSDMVDEEDADGGKVVKIDFSALAEANKKRDWTVGFVAGSPNCSLSKAFREHMINNINPKKDIGFTTSDEEGGKNNKKKQKLSMIFVNIKFAWDMNGFSADFVFPVSNVYVIKLGLGNYSGDPINKGEEFLKDDLFEAKKQILLSDEGFEGARMTEDGANADFQEAAVRDFEITLRLAMFLIKFRPDLFRKADSQGHPMYIEAIYASACKDKMMVYESAVATIEKEVQEKEITQEKAKEKLKRAQQTNCINSRGEVDVEAVRKSMKLREVAKKLCSPPYMKEPIKTASRGFRYATFVQKVLRRTTDKERERNKKTPPVHPTPLFKTIFDTTNGEFVYNEHTVEQLSDWGGNKQPRILSDDERAAAGVADYAKAVPKNAKISIGFKYSVFTDSGKDTWGVRKELTRIIFHRGPNAEEEARAASDQRGYKPPEDRKEVVIGSEPLRKYDSARPVFAVDPIAAKKVQEAVAADLKKAMKKKREQEESKKA
jgi:hypothetical protein